VGEQKDQKIELQCMDDLVHPSVPDSSPSVLWARTKGIDSRQEGEKQWLELTPKVRQKVTARWYEHLALYDMQYSRVAAAVALRRKTSTFERKRVRRQQHIDKGKGSAFAAYKQWRDKRTKEKGKKGDPRVKPKRAEEQEEVKEEEEEREENKHEEDDEETEPDEEGEAPKRREGKKKKRQQAPRARVLAPPVSSSLGKRAPPPPPQPKQNAKKRRLLGSSPAPHPSRSQPVSLPSRSQPVLFPPPAPLVSPPSPARPAFVPPPAPVVPSSTPQVNILDQSTDSCLDW